MARRFRGSETYKMDAKGRVSIPSAFRRVIEAGDPDWSPEKRPNIVVVYGGPERKWLEVYTMEAIYEIDEQIDMMQRGSPERAEIEDLMYAQSHQTEIDGDGRFVLPQKLREKIGLTSDVYFASAGTSFKIWAPDVYADEQAGVVAERAQTRPANYDPLIHLPKIGGGQ